MGLYYMEIPAKLCQVPLTPQNRILIASFRYENPQKYYTHHYMYKLAAIELTAVSRHFRLLDGVVPFIPLNCSQINQLYS